jgi:hypothetical protein
VEELEQERKHLQARERALLKLPGRFEQLEYRASLFYIRKMVMLAAEKGVQVRFLYMPTFRGKALPDFSGFYGQFAPVWRMPRDVLDHNDLWLDVGHLNTRGADAFSKWLGERIAADTIGVNQSLKTFQRVNGSSKGL